MDTVSSSSFSGIIRGHSLGAGAGVGSGAVLTEKNNFGRSLKEWPISTDFIRQQSSLPRSCIWDDDRSACEWSRIRKVALAVIILVLVAWGVAVPLYFFVEFDYLRFGLDRGDQSDVSPSFRLNTSKLSPHSQPTVASSPTLENMMNNDRDALSARSNEVTINRGALPPRSKEVNIDKGAKPPGSNEVNVDRGAISSWSKEVNIESGVPSRLDYNKHVVKGSFTKVPTNPFERLMKPTSTITPNSRTAFWAVPRKFNGELIRSSKPTVGQSSTQLGVGNRVGIAGTSTSIQLEEIPVELEKSHRVRISGSGVAGFGEDFVIPSTSLGLLRDTKIPDRTS